MDGKVGLGLNVGLLSSRNFEAAVSREHLLRLQVINPLKCLL